jgi:hypothetical protein
MESMPPTDQSMMAVAVEPVPSVTVSVVISNWRVVGVPEMTPVDESIDSPLGRLLTL